MIRKATTSDIEQISTIYEKIHAQQELGHITTGWVRGVYPTADTASGAVSAGDMYVYEADGIVIAAGRINQEQGKEYARVNWSINAPTERVLVLHTLVVDPAHTRKGIASAFVSFYEELAKQMNCLCLRMDTNEHNHTARTLYHRLGFCERSIVPCCFNGIEGVRLVCLEKML